VPCWRDEAGYTPLRAVDRLAFAWEWLRRDPAYRAAAAASPAVRAGDRFVLLPQNRARRWGLHAFEDVRLPAPLARPVWRAGLQPVLQAVASSPGRPEENFELARLSHLATVVAGEGGEHWLFSDGRTSLRLDVIEGTLLEGPVGLELRIPGLAGLDSQLETLRKLLTLLRTGRLPPPQPVARLARQILLLRAHDALACGATQRQIAEQLLSVAPLASPWRLEDPSLRLRAQRLVHGARRMASGGWLDLLGGDRARSAPADHDLLGLAQRAGRAVAHEPG
jgi:hypothetical protein